MAMNLAFCVLCAGIWGKAGIPLPSIYIWESCPPDCSCRWDRLVRLDPWWSRWKRPMAGFWISSPMVRVDLGIAAVSPEPLLGWAYPARSLEAHSLPIISSLAIQARVASGLWARSLDGSPPFRVGIFAPSAYQYFRRRSRRHWRLAFCHPTSPVWDTDLSGPCWCECWNQCSAFPWVF